MRQTTDKTKSLEGKAGEGGDALGVRVLKSSCVLWETYTMPMPTAGSELRKDLRRPYTLTSGWPWGSAHKVKAKKEFKLPEC